MDRATTPGQINLVGAKSAKEIDKLVGARVRMARNDKSMSQEALGDALDLTFQQIQKYEKGSNRISASKLVMISRIVGKPITYFFDDVLTPIASDERDDVLTLAAGSRPARELVAAAAKLERGKDNTRLQNLANIAASLVPAQVSHG